MNASDTFDHSGQFASMDEAVAHFEHAPRERLEAELRSEGVDVAAELMRFRRVVRGRRSIIRRYAAAAIAAAAVLLFALTLLVVHHVKQSDQMAGETAQAPAAPAAAPAPKKPANHLAVVAPAPRSDDTPALSLWIRPPRVLKGSGEEASTVAAIARFEDLMHIATHSGTAADWILSADSLESHAATKLFMRSLIMSGGVNGATSAYPPRASRWTRLFSSATPFGSARGFGSYDPRFSLVALSACASDARDVTELDATEALEALRALKTVTYEYASDSSETDHYVGFLAEDIPQFVRTGERDGLRAADIVAVLTTVVQEQQKTIDELQQRIAQLEEKERPPR